MLGDRPVGPLLVAREKGIPIKIIANVFPSSSFSIFSLASKPIRSLADLKGKSMMVGPSTLPLVIYLIKNAGVDPNTVTFVPASPDPSALVNGQIDALPGFITSQGVALRSRGVDIFTLKAADLGVPDTTGVIYAREDYLQKNHDLVVRFLRAAVESWRWALAHPDETARMMIDKYGSPGLDLKTQEAEIKASKPFIEEGPRGAAGLLALDLPVYGRIIDIYRKAGMIKSAMAVETVCDASYINAALAA